MGIISAIGAGIAAIGTACKAAVSAISATKIGAALAGAGKAIIGVVQKIPGIEKIGDILKILDSASKILDVILKVFGVEQEDSAEKLAYKAEHCDRRRSEFPSMEEYMKYVSKTEIDEAEFAKMQENEVERLKYNAIGTAMKAEALSEKSGIEIGPGIIPVLYSVNNVVELATIPEKVIELIEALKTEGITDSKDIANFLTGEKGVRANVVESAMQRALSKLGAKDPDAMIEAFKESVKKGANQ